MLHCIIIFSPVVVSCWLPTFGRVIILECSGRFELLGTNLDYLLVCQREVGLEREEGGRLKDNSVIESVSIHSKR